MPLMSWIKIAGLSLACATLLVAQTVTTTAVPRVVRVNSSFHPADGSAAAMTEGVTLSIYTAQTGGTALWQETQNVAVDRDGHYSVLLGATHNEGLPAELFASGEPRWLGVQFSRAGEVEQPRTLLASVPYALKAGDAETLGGLPASAYLLNPSAASATAAAPGTARAATALPRLNSTGTAGSIAMFTDNAGDIGNSVLFQTGDKVGLGTANQMDYFHVVFNDTSGAYTGIAVQNLGSGANSYSGMLFYDQTGTLGQFQGFNNSTHEYRINNIAQTKGTADGTINFMIGGQSAFKVRTDTDIDVTHNIRQNGAILINTLGSYNTSVGSGAMAASGGAFPANSENTALGYAAAANLNGGFNNTAVGFEALEANVSSFQNTAVGSQALSQTTASKNTALGYIAGIGITTGANNIAIGYSAGSSLSTGSNNIIIGNTATSGDANAIRIGTQGTQTNTYIAGISGVNVINAAPVVVDSNGHVGVSQSSRRYKEDIQDMSDASADLYRLRPVTYRYKQASSDGSKPLDYGLIAEEVAQVYPGLVVRNNDGQIETVQYQKLAPMLLNELQKEHLRAEQRDQTIQSLKEEIEGLRKAIDSLMLGPAVTSGGH